MKISFGIIVMGVLIATQSVAVSRLDPMLRRVVDQPDSLSLSATKTVREWSGDRIEVLVKVTDAVQGRMDIESLGGRVVTVAGNILVIRILPSKIEALSQLPTVVYVEAAKPVNPKLNFAHTVTGVADVHAGTGVTALDGTGVVVGIVDSGIDCDHADFKNASGTTRILAYWDQSTGSDGVAEVSGSAGTEYTGSALADGGACVSGAPDSDSGTPAHGTHVAGIAAGNDATYKGVAPGANLVAVLQSSDDADSGGTFSTSVINGISYIFKKANTAQMPAVANVSLGTSLGAHDGTSLFEEGLDSLLIESGSTEKVGRAITCAAGNENLHSSYSGSAEYGGIHATISASSAEGTGYEFRARSSQAFSVFGGMVVDAWLTADSTCTIEVDGFDDTTRDSFLDMSPVSSGGTGSATGSDISVSLDFTDSPNALNGKQHAQVVVIRSNTATVTDKAFDIIFKGTCSGHMWLYPDYTSLVGFTKDREGEVAAGGYTFSKGDSVSTMTVPCTASGPISTSSYMARESYVDVNGTTHDQTDVTGSSATDVSTFASLGPSADDRVKPDITAPGEPIISTLASTASVSASKKGDATHHKLEGTSMAAPYVAGVVALMLEKNGCLTASEIKTAIQSSAATDAFTDASGALPNSTWGYGKIDAVGAVNAVTASDCVPSNTSEVVETPDPTPTSSSSSGCALSPYRAVNQTLLGLWFLTVLGLASGRFIRFPNYR